jgi:YesN/AraC family two-component response regulator
MERMPDLMPSISILLVEDVKVTLDLITLILAKKYPGVALHNASNGREGLEIFKAHTPDIVITDINMPEMCGVQMVNKICAIEPKTKFIIITGRSEKSSLQDSVDKGFEFDHYIVKPIVFQDLFDAIEQCFVEIAQHQSIYNVTS